MLNLFSCRINKRNCFMKHFFFKKLQLQTTINALQRINASQCLLGASCSIVFTWFLGALRKHLRNFTWAGKRMKQTSKRQEWRERGSAECFKNIAHLTIIKQLWLWLCYHFNRRSPFIHSFFKLNTWRPSWLDDGWIHPYAEQLNKLIQCRKQSWGSYIKLTVMISHHDPVL